MIALRRWPGLRPRQTILVLTGAALPCAVSAPVAGRLAGAVARAAGIQTLVVVAPVATLTRSTLLSAGATTVALTAPVAVRSVGATGLATGPHLHYEVTGGKPDETYLAPERRAHEDRLAWKHWQATRMAADQEKICALIDSQTIADVR
jgi:MFS family permease